MLNVIKFQLNNESLIDTFVNGRKLHLNTYQNILNRIIRLTGKIIIIYPDIYSVIYERINFLIDDYNDFNIKNKIIWYKYRTNRKIDYKIFFNGFLCFYTGIYPEEKRNNGIIHIKGMPNSTFDKKVLLLKSNINSAYISENSSVNQNFGLYNIKFEREKIEILSTKNQECLAKFRISFYKLSEYRNNNVSIDTNTFILIENDNSIFYKLMENFIKYSKIKVKYIIPYYKDEINYINGKNIKSITKIEFYSQERINNVFLKIKQLQVNEKYKNARRCAISDVIFIKNIIKSLVIDLLNKNLVDIHDEVYIYNIDSIFKKNKEYIFLSIKNIYYKIDARNLIYYRIQM